MLVLTRKPGESIRIGEDIEIVVIQARRGRVKIGFRCPSEISIRREEVLDAFGSDSERWFGRGKEPLLTSRER